MADPHAFHTPKSSYTKADLILSGRGGYFGPGNAQLPAPPMLMMDRITELSLDGGEFGKGHVVAELEITPDLWFFDCHFPGDPVMPGCLGLDAMWQVLGYWLGWSGSPGKGPRDRRGRGQVSRRRHACDPPRALRGEPAAGPARPAGGSRCERPAVRGRRLRLCRDRPEGRNDRAHGLRRRRPPGLRPPGWPRASRAGRAGGRRSRVRWSRWGVVASPSSTAPLWRSRITSMLS